MTTRVIINPLLSKHIVLKNYDIDDIASKLKPSQEYSQMCSKFNNTYPFTTLSNTNNSLFKMFYEAYNNHFPIVLNPNDMWQNMLNYLSFFVSNRSESLRHLFVNHEGKKTLEIVEMGSSYKGEDNWDYFFLNIIKKIQENTVFDVNIMKSDFIILTSNEFYNLIETSTIMATMKMYFQYKRSCTRCGIREVHFEGTIKDWDLLITKLQNLLQFTSRDEFADFPHYIKEYIKIIMMIATYL